MFSFSSYPYKTFYNNNNNNNHHPSTPVPQPSTTPRPTIILVHGGWQGPETFSLLIPLLEAANYSVVAVALPSSSSSSSCSTIIPATPSFAPDVAAVRSVVLATLTTGKDVLLVMHSWGAVVGCEALKDLDAGMPTQVEKVGKVVKLAFIAGLVIPEGKAVLGGAAAAAGVAMLPGFECQENLITVLDGPHRFYNDLPAPIAAQWASRLRKHSRLAFLSPLTFAAYRHHPSAYLACARDNGVPLHIQRRFVAAAGISDVEVCDSGHSPMVSRAEEVAGWVRRCAGEKTEEEKEDMGNGVGRSKL